MEENMQGRGSTIVGNDTFINPEIETIEKMSNDVR